MNKDGTETGVKTEMNRSNTGIGQLHEHVFIIIFWCCLPLCVHIFARFGKIRNRNKIKWAKEKPMTTMLHGIIGD